MKRLGSVPKTLQNFGRQTNGVRSYLLDEARLKQQWLDGFEIVKLFEQNLSAFSTQPCFHFSFRWQLQFHSPESKEFLYLAKPKGHPQNPHVHKPYTNVEFRPIPIRTILNHFQYWGFQNFQWWLSCGPGLSTVLEPSVEVVGQRMLSASPKDQPIDFAKLAKYWGLTVSAFPFSRRSPARVCIAEWCGKDGEADPNVNGSWD